MKIAAIIFILATTVLPIIAYSLFFIIAASQPKWLHEQYRKYNHESSFVKRASMIVLYLIILASTFALPMLGGDHLIRQLASNAETVLGIYEISDNAGTIRYISFALTSWSVIAIHCLVEGYGREKAEKNYYLNKLIEVENQRNELYAELEELKKGRKLE